RPVTGPVEVLDAELSTVTAAADKVVRVGGAVPWVWHVEPQSSRAPGQAATLRLYNALLADRFGPPVRTTLLLLRRSADAPDLTGLLEERFPDEEPYLTFRYQVVRVWQQPLAAFLEGGLGLLPLAPLTGVTEAELPGVLRRMEERIT